MQRSRQRIYKIEVVDLFFCLINNPVHAYVSHNSGFVYKLNCSCGQSYIGQTRRNLITKINDHKPHGKSNQESDVSKHLILNFNHSIDFNSPEIIERSSSNRKLRIKVNLLIQKYKLLLNLDETSHPIYLFNT